MKIHETGEAAGAVVREVVGSLEEYFLDISSEAASRPLLPEIDWDYLERQFIDHLDGVEVRDPELVRLEVMTHEAITPWIANHSERSKGKIGDTGYNPDTQTYHRLDEGYTPPYKVPFWVPSSLVVRRIKRELVKGLGTEEKVEEMVKVYQETPAYAGAERSISEDVDWRLRRRQTVGFLVDHLEKEDLRDVAIAVAGLEAAIGRKKVRELTAVVLGKNIGRQDYTPENGTKKYVLAEVVLKVMGIVWVMQDTDNRKALPIPKEAVKISDDAADEAFNRILGNGALIAEVPSGTAMKLETDENGQLKYIRPTVRGAVANLMRMDALLPVAIYKGVVQAGPMEVIDESEETTRKDKKMMVVRALRSLAVNDANLTGLPVEFEDLESKGSTVMVYPDGYAQAA